MPQKKHLAPATRLLDRFGRVKAFVVRKFPSLGRIKLHWCDSIVSHRKSGKGIYGIRSFMHAGHVQDGICTTREVLDLPDPILVGMLLHEFGHTAGNPGELEADAWAMRNFGIPIEYKTELMLEWVDPEIIDEKRILG